ncbi:hypothetical protein H6G74_21945 [Nostoc spongiaeforme FACHB-130]|uniref:Uncharacterized protein n=1 Tax=Nostoc spongiaeforme FACHB-130 TaxID=1357510 RepID=A0ABR8G159_9NOSO|nr:hypothetical protein [Nostoc spongiaeforme]MBD2596969.1 hypothetical protein [Nostoc spongiaeforme FACHB-130]
MATRRAKGKSKNSYNTSLLAILDSLFIYAELYYLDFSLVRNPGVWEEWEGWEEWEDSEQIFPPTLPTHT